MADLQSTSLNRGWLLKIILFAAAAAGLGLWGLIDATIVYPRSGEADSSFRLKNYLERAKDAGRITQTRVTDPHKDLADLASRRAQLSTAAAELSMSGRIAAMELAKLDWLESLKRLWRLDSAPGRISDPDKQLADLTTEWKKKSAPKPLSPLDLHIQWIITGVGFFLAAWIVFVIFKSKSQASKYTWDADSQRLTLPGGASFTPADLRELDKRKWHKYFVTVITKDGRSHKLDLLRYTPLEDWILAMERTAFPEAAAQSNAAPAGGDPEPA